MIVIIAVRVPLRYTLLDIFNPLNFRRRLKEAVEKELRKRFEVRNMSPLEDQTLPSYDQLQITRQSLDGQEAPTSKVKA